MSRRRIRTRIERDNADFLGDDYRFTRDPELATQRAENRRQFRLSRPPLRFEQCAIRGCRERVYGNAELSVCEDHAVVIWEIVEKRDQSPFLRECLSAAIERRDTIRAQQREAVKAEEQALRTAPDAEGDIYYAKVGDLIKVGWSSDLYQRMRSYGPHAELLVHYRATRADETYLHRQLKPSRAKGREWYADDAIIRAFVARALREHGEPRFVTLDWTDPKQQPARVKSWR
jgi:hypothetical protein